MNLLLVLDSDDNCGIISRSTGPLGFALVRYRHVLKAMDNIDEINPAVIIVSAKDFPRHWKILVQFVRSERPREICSIIILKGAGFSTEETSKALFLGANEVLDDTLDKPESLDRLLNILSRKVPLDERRKHNRFFVEPWDRVGFLVASTKGDTKDKSIITGNVKTISARGLSFLPDESTYSEGIALCGELNECSLRVGDAILSPVCRVVRTEGQPRTAGPASDTNCVLSLEFMSLPKDEQRILDQYLHDIPLPEITAEKLPENFSQ